MDCILSTRLLLCVMCDVQKIRLQITFLAIRFSLDRWVAFTNTCDKLPTAFCRKECCLNKSPGLKGLNKTLALTAQSHRYALMLKHQAMCFKILQVGLTVRFVWGHLQ